MLGMKLEVSALTLRLGDDEDDEDEDEDEEAASGLAGHCASTQQDTRSATSNCNNARATRVELPPRERGVLWRTHITNQAGTGVPRGNKQKGQRGLCWRLESERAARGVVLPRTGRPIIGLPLQLRSSSSPKRLAVARTSPRILS